MGVPPPAGGLQALTEQAIAYLANAWTLRRWRGLLYRGRDVYRATGALIHKLASDAWRHRSGPSYYGNVLEPQGDCGGIDEPQLPAVSLLV